MTYRPGYLDLLPSPTTTADPESTQDRSIDLDPSTKYLTFLPHSGFHNQRTELENALLLARLLNRTLIMPKVYLGPPMPWRTFRLLHTRLLYQTKIGLEHCRAIIENQEEKEIEERQEQAMAYQQMNEQKQGTEERSMGRMESQTHEALSPPLSSWPSPLPPTPRPQEPWQQQKQQHRHHHHNHHHSHYQQSPSGEVPSQLRALNAQQRNSQGSTSISIDKLGAATSGFQFTEENSTPNPSIEEDMAPEGRLDKEALMDILIDARGDEEESEEEPYNLSDVQPDLGSVEGSFETDKNNFFQEQGSGEGFAGGEEEEVPSWVEESADEDGNKTRIATGDNVSDIVNLEEDIHSDEKLDQGMTDRRAVRDEEDGENRGSGGIQMGIPDDLDEHNANWGKPGYLVQSDPSIPGYNGERLLMQQQVGVEASLPLYVTPLDSNLQKNRARVMKRSLLTGSEPEKLGFRNSRRDRRGSRPQKPQVPDQHPFQQIQEQAALPVYHYPTQLKPQHQQPVVGKHRRMKWSPLPAECLQYESWTMTDWDFFFDLNPLRRYVRVLTRESMSMQYLADRFNLTLPKEEDEQNSATTKATAAIDGSNVGTGITSKEGKEENKDKGSAEGDASAGEEGDEKKKSLILRTEGDVLFFDDSSLYDYRFTENPDAEESIRARLKYQEEFTVEWLAQRPERLIHLGSIFGTGRVSIDSLESKAWLLMIRDHLILGTDILQTTSQRIADKISGRVVTAADTDADVGGTHPDRQAYGGTVLSDSMMDAGFVGIHIRMSDGHFSLTARETIENSRQELMWQVGITGEEEYMGGDDGGIKREERGRLSIEQCRSRALNHRRTLQRQLRKQRSQPQQHSISQTSPSTPRRRSNGQFTPIYLATDAHRPRANPIFDKLFETFECIFTLDDFSEDLELLHHFRNPEDGTLMAKFLIPMVDAMVVAKSAAFFGTPASTFSNYIQRQLRPAYTGLYD
ncbi:hypothetical protein BC939DRAFT_478259 [Gamsiella multidivaricata]|uniref:uncharacterized protein n=1 Tax=Gamsiella multidivaricata TaxID=101098 RepID=UPI00221EB194|nr:uncharacterized protein BC939DRAFT_478259 [Gamsiella multidivaricata]KAI7821545.1 hypothetical protein BC939DRAFT_478259 [Gamsiella multidivaricata]